jgi:hypothetical protein
VLSRPSENPRYSNLTYPKSGQADDENAPFPAIVCDNIGKPSGVWPPTVNQKLLSSIFDTGNITFQSLITEDIYNMMFPYHYKTYSYSGLIDALQKHPEGWRLGGEGSNETRKRDIAAFLANCSHESGNGNGPSIISNSSISNSNNGPWSTDATYFGDVWGQKFFKCYCGGGLWGKDCGKINYSAWSRYTPSTPSTQTGGWCGSDPDSNVWKSSNVGPSGWIGALSCVDEGCPEYPGSAPINPGNYCQSSSTFMSDWNAKKFPFFTKYPNQTDPVYGGTSDSPCSPDFPCPCFGTSDAPKKYFGRGPIQLSYNFNYGLFSVNMYKLGITKSLFGVDDPLYLLKNPELVETNPTLLWMTAVDFWISNRSPTYNYISCHDAMVLGSERTDHGFGLADNIVNGGCGLLKKTLESVGMQPYLAPTDQEVNRAIWYQVYTYAFGITP